MWTAALCQWQVRCAILGEFDLSYLFYTRYKQDSLIIIVSSKKKFMADWELSVCCS